MKSLASGSTYLSINLCVCVLSIVDCVCVCGVCVCIAYLCDRECVCVGERESVREARKGEWVCGGMWVEGCIKLIIWNRTKLDGYPLRAWYISLPHYLVIYCTKLALIGNQLVNGTHQEICSSNSSCETHFPLAFCIYFGLLSMTTLGWNIVNSPC